MTDSSGQTWQQKLLDLQRRMLDQAALADLSIEQNRVFTASTAYRGKYNIQLRRVLASTLFSENIDVVYTYPNPMSFTPRQQGAYRDITHVVISSFGSFYDSQLLNKGVRVISGGEVRIPDVSSSDSFHNANRVWSGIRSVIVNTGKKLSGAHFYIDRLGNLIIMGDIDMAMIGDVPSSASAVFVALEESIYVPVSSWYKERPHARAILSGEERNVISDGFTAAQYTTLGILLRKLEVGLPELVGGGGGGDFTSVVNRAVTIPLADRDDLAIRKIKENDTSGYITDAWPNLTTEEEWQDLFENYVDIHEDVTEDDIWRSPIPLVMPWLENIQLSDPAAFPKNEFAAEIGVSVMHAANGLVRIPAIFADLDPDVMREKAALERRAENKYIGIQTANAVATMNAVATPDAALSGYYDIEADDNFSDVGVTTDDSWEV